MQELTVELAGILSRGRMREVRRSATGDGGAEIEDRAGAEEQNKAVGCGGV